MLSTPKILALKSHTTQPTLMAVRTQLPHKSSVHKMCSLAHLLPSSTHLRRLEITQITWSSSATKLVSIQASMELTGLMPQKVFLANGTSTQLCIWMPLLQLLHLSLATFFCSRLHKLSQESQTLSWISNISVLSKTLACWYEKIHSMRFLSRL